MKRYGSFTGLIIFALLISSSLSMAADWPQWRYDSYRSGNSPELLPDDLHLQWVREYPQLEPVWDDPLNQDLMQYDTVYEPVVVGDTMFVGSNANDNVVAVNTNTGEELWAYYTDGPVRCPPSVYEGKVYFTSDDGCLYCVNAEDGELVWKYNSVSSDRKVIGNERLVSTWSARGGQVVQDGVVYFGSGIWPFMGVFLFAIDAETGKEIWINDSSSAPFINQPHNSPSFAGIAPQGNLVATKDRLLVPGGRSVPASFDLKTGEFQYYQLASSGKTGGAFVCANDKYFINYHRDHVTHLYDLETGKRVIAELGKVPVVDGEIFYCKGDTVSAKQAVLKEFQKRERDRSSGESKIVTEKKLDAETLWEVEVDASGEIIKAGNTLYVGGNNSVSAISLPSAGNPAKVMWQQEVEGEVKRIIAANGQLYAVTLDGKIYAFGGEQVEPVHHKMNTQIKVASNQSKEKAQSVLKTIAINDGYGLVYNLDDSNLLQEMVMNSEIYFSVVEPDAKNILQWRNQFSGANLHGKRVSFKPGEAGAFSTPQYTASMIYIGSTDNLTADDVAQIYQQLRPYGGTLYVSNSTQSNDLVEKIKQNDLPKASIETSDEYILIKREGKLPGAADWTHQYGDVANTIKSDDSLVKLPMGLLWYGGSSNTDVLPRHGHGPPQQVVGGKLFIEGMDSLSARDVYTGRVLWKRVFPDLGNYGVYYDETYEDTPLDTKYNQIHIPGANARGTNYVVTEDRIYLVKQDHCLVMDSETGKDIMTITLPKLDDDEENEWGYVGVYDNYLIAGVGFVSYMDYIDMPENLAEKRKVFYNYDITSSKHIAVMDRFNGEVKWTISSELGFNHNAIVVGNDTLYCIDKMPPIVVETLQRRGMEIPGTPKLHALNISNGDEVWSTEENIFGTWLGYSEEYNTLLQAGRPSRDMLRGEEGKGMLAYNADTGDVIWQNEVRYDGPCILYHDQIITDRFSYSLTSGNQIMRRNPVTGEDTPWEFQRNYGCNYAIASEHFMTFRSAAAGFYDLETDGGTGNFGGFKSSCTSTLIVANGVLNAPDYTRTCSCSYQNQTSLAMVHDPEVEMWTFNEIEIDDQSPIQRLGINLGAPGDRRADNGTLWLDYPIVGGPSPEIPIQTIPVEPKYFLGHSSRVSGDELKWVQASGVEGLEKLTVKLTPSSSQKQTYNVRLLFMEPSQHEAGDRVFDVVMQGNTVISNLDVTAEAGSNRAGIMKEINDVEVAGDLVIEFKTVSSSQVQKSILSGIEIVVKNQVSQLN